MDVKNQYQSEEPVLISVVIPFFGSNSDPLLRTLDSLYNIQLDFQWETIIAFEGLSVPKEINLYLERGSCSDIKLIQLNPNVGLPASLNIGISHARGEFICRLDAGDVISDPNRFKVQLGFLRQNEDVWCVGTGVRLVNTDGSFIRDRFYPEFHDQIVRQAYKTNPICHPTVMFRKAVFITLGGYDVKHFNEDYELWLRSISLGHKMHNLKMITVDYELTRPSSGRSRAFLKMLAIRFMYLDSIIRLFFISVPITVSQALLFKFPGIFHLINSKFR